MAIQSISSSNSNLSNASRIKFNSNSETMDYDRKEIAKEKREEANKIIKKVYRRGIFTGVVVTSIAFFADLITNHYLDKQDEKEAEKFAKNISKDLNHSIDEIEQLISNGLKDAKTSDKQSNRVHIPIISTIKKAVRRI